jgi:hypothetical protein
LSRQSRPGAYRSQELLDAVITSLHKNGLSLQAAQDLPPDAAREHIAEASGISTTRSARSATQYSLPAATAARPE